METSAQETGTPSREPDQAPARNEATTAGRRLEAELRRRFRTQPQLFDEFQASMLDGVWYSNPNVLGEEWLSAKFWQTLG